MTDSSQGIRLPLSPARKLVTEMLHHARKQPSIPVARPMSLGRLADLRRQLAAPPSWTALFLRAFGLAARRFPELRRAYIPWPVAHLYEHPFSVGAVVVERHLPGETVLLAAKVRSPEDTPLATLQDHLRHFKHAPVWEVSDFRQLLRLARLPWPLLRMAFWHSLYCSGVRRAKRFGTFMVSSYGSLGAEQIHPLTCLSTLLTFGPIDRRGEVVVKVVYDHRVMDGACVARALAELERLLRTEVAEELAVGQAAPASVSLAED